MLFFDKSEKLTAKKRTKKKEREKKKIEMDFHTM